MHVRRQCAAVATGFFKSSPSSASSSLLDPRWYAADGGSASSLTCRVFCGEGGCLRATVERAWCQYLLLPTIEHARSSQGQSSLVTLVSHLADKADAQEGHAEAKHGGQRHSLNLTESSSKEAAAADTAVSGQQPLCQGQGAKRGSCRVRLRQA